MKFACNLLFDSSSKLIVTSHCFSCILFLFVEKYDHHTKIVTKQFILFMYFIVIPVTRRLKGYTRFVGKYVTGRRNQDH